MRRIASLLFLVGVLLLAALTASQGFSAVASALLAAGWAALWPAAYRVVTILLDAAGWFLLLRGRCAVAFSRFAKARWIAESANTLLPTAQVGGHVLRTALLSKSGVDKPLAGGSVLVDFTLGLCTQFMFIAFGALLMLFIATAGSGAGDYWPAVAACIPAVGGFLALQRLGFARIFKPILARLSKKGRFDALLIGVEQLDAVTSEMYADTRRIAPAALLRLAAWLSRCGETYIILNVLGFPVGPLEAAAIEAMATLANSAGFMIPGSLGVREGGIVLFAGMVGVPGETAMALALLKRLRELVVGLPGLLVWTISDFRNIFSASFFSSRGVNKTVDSQSKTLP